MMMLQDRPIDEIRREKKKLKSKRHELHVMMSAYCTINCNEDTAQKKDIDHKTDTE